MLIVSIRYLQRLVQSSTLFPKFTNLFPNSLKIFIVKIFNIDFPQPERLNYKKIKIRDEASLYLKIFTLLNL